VDIDDRNADRKFADGILARPANPPFNETSVDVPPISKLTIFGKPAALARYRDPTTPPAGPDRAVRIGSFLAFSAEI
jgi:hypothetical protein